MKERIVTVSHGWRLKKRRKRSLIRKAFPIADTLILLAAMQRFHTAWMEIALKLGFILAMTMRRRPCEVLSAVAASDAR
jgi:hypothetical protein